MPGGPACPRVGIVGWGSIARRHRLSLESAGARCAGIVTRRHSVAGDVPCYDSIEALLPHVDGVTIAVPNALHARLAAAAIQAGKAVFVEKPLVTTSQDLDSMAAVLATARAPVYVGFRLRWNPRLRQLRARVAEPRLIRTRFGLGIDELGRGKPWTHDAAATGGAYFTLGCHMLDLARWLAHAPGERLADLRAHASGDEVGSDYPLRAVVEGRLGSRTHVRASADTRTGTPYRIEASVEHDEGTQERVIIGVEDESLEYAAMFADFVNDITTGNSDRMNMDDMLNLHRDLLAARRATGGD